MKLEKFFRKSAIIPLLTTFSLSAEASEKVIPLKLNHPREGNAPIIINADCGLLEHGRAWDFFKSLDPYPHPSWKVKPEEQSNNEKLSFIIGHILAYERTWNRERLKKVVNTCESNINIDRVLHSAPNAAP